MSALHHRAECDCRFCDNIRLNAVPLAERLLSRTIPEPNTGCLFWLGAADGGGYGFLIVKGRYVWAHRAAYEIAHGPIPGRLHVLHHCDTPLCVNVDHLFLGTQLDNVRDAVQKGRMRGKWSGMTVCQRGHEMTESNTFHSTCRGRPIRGCRACRLLRRRTYAAARSVA